MALEPLFGINIDPRADNWQNTFERAQVADRAGLDLLTSQDHPYNKTHLDTWTLLSAVAAVTHNIHIGTNVANLPLRPPAMLAKAAASLDVLSGGRVELGIGAGAFWRGVAAYGGPERSPGEAYEAFSEALDIIRGMWDKAGGSLRYEGRHYQVQGAQPGPAPLHPIRIWVGAIGPRMLRLVGAKADGVLVSITYVPPLRLNQVNDRIDEGAAAAGRDPEAVRRGYNLMGVIRERETRGITSQDTGIDGPVDYWIEEIIRLRCDFRQDTFLFWPTEGDPIWQIERFAYEIAPAVREQTGGGA
ncbi:MAG TPA: LLM class flavin-dependent oxidoreductase [Spirillospora sp.]|nr:LLM class flavin-dependent oxidoreductase [Spirillospora sp.]